MLTLFWKEHVRATMSIDDELLAKASKPDSTPDALEFVIRHADPLSQALEDAIRLGAEGGDALAQAQLAERFRRGDGVPRDDRMAFRWALAAAEQGLAGA